MARLDRVLKFLCLVKTRSQGTQACKEGRVLVNGAPARPSHEVRAGDRIVLRDRMGVHETRVEIVQVPDRQVARRDVSRFARVERSRREPIA
jgi:ribosomal 50S subunit-recycling heat shock protein